MGDWDEPLFRDYLIAHPATAAEYAKLKRGLFSEFEHSRDGYTYAKTKFIKNVMEKAKDEPPLGYIMNLRKFVGHMPLITIGAGVIIENEEGKVLLGRRRDNGLWDLGGGGMELGESLEDCAKRELFEEMGLTAHSLEFLDIFSGRPPITCPSGDIIEHIAVIYICRDFGGEIKAQEEEVRELRWFSVDTLIKDITQITLPSRIFFEKYIESRKQHNPDF
jgi:8-oxo-dGTP pyrophosphatase MutT (NUDIX family)